MSVINKALALVTVNSAPLVLIIDELAALTLPVQPKEIQLLAVTSFKLPIAIPSIPISFALFPIAIE